MPAKPFVGTYDTIEQIAETFRSRFGIKPEEKLGGSSRLLELVSKTGGKVGILNQPAAYEADGGSLVIRGPNQYTIFLSPYTTPLRDNFTIAHELGHFVLHYVLRRTELEGELPLRFARYGTGEMGGKRIASPPPADAESSVRGGFHKVGATLCYWRDDMASLARRRKTAANR